MITATVIAVALGLTPADAGKPNQLVTGDYEGQVGRYSETVDSRGTVHVRGSNPRNNTPYEMTISRGGEVEANLGETVVSFRIQPAR